MPGRIIAPFSYSPAISRAIVGRLARPWQPWRNGTRSSSEGSSYWGGSSEFPRADATGQPAQDVWGRFYFGVNDYREGRYAGAVRQLAEVPGLTEHPYCLTLTHLFLAMAEQKLGHVAESRRELDAARKLLEGLGRHHGWRDSSVPELMDYGWTEWVIATVVRNEAEVPIVYDPIFPEDPFAP